MDENANKTTLLDSLKRLGVLYIENAKLTAAEKLTLLMSGIALITVIVVLGVLSLIFIVIGLSNLLESYIPPFCSYFIVAGILLLIGFIIYYLRDRLVINPIARFISRLFVDPPKNK